MAIFLITGPSGVGKTSLVKELEFFGFWEECISHTTRPIRKGEVDGETYHFVSEEKFFNMLENGEFVEHVMYHNHHYGVSKKEIERVLKRKRAVIIVDYNGYLQIKKQYPDAVGIFIWTDKNDCYNNMISRGDSALSASTRLLTYDREMLHKTIYDYVIKNVKGGYNGTLKILMGIVSQYN